MKLYLNNNRKIILAIISCLLVYIYTNLSKQTINNTNNTLYNLFFHNEGCVCPLGVLCGKLFIIITIILVFLLYYKKYNNLFKIIHFIFLILAILISLINISLLIKLIPVYLLQILIIFF
jgi:hypothetical protein